MTKILVSGGFGAGWSTWSSSPKEVAEYLPIIEFLEAGGEPSDLNDDHILVKRMIEDLDLNHFYTGGAEGLYVDEVRYAYRIEEYDGSESVTTAADFW